MKLTVFLQSIKPAMLMLSVVSLLFPSVLLAATAYTPLIPLPGLSEINDASFEKYLEIVYILAISIAAFIAVVKLMLAGLQYIGEGLSVTSKEAAKTDIQQAILGLVIILLATTILRTINPQLVNLVAIPNAPSFNQLFPRAEVVARPPSVSDKTLAEMRVICAAKTPPTQPVVAVVEGGRHIWSCNSHPDEFQEINSPDEVRSSLFQNTTELATYVRNIKSSGVIVNGQLMNLEINSNNTPVLESLQSAIETCSLKRKGNDFEIVIFTGPDGIKRTQLLCLNKP